MLISKNSDDSENNTVTCAHRGQTRATNSQPRDLITRRTDDDSRKRSMSGFPRRLVARSHLLGPGRFVHDFSSDTPPGHSQDTHRTWFRRVAHDDQIASNGYVFVYDARQGRAFRRFENLPIDVLPRWFTRAVKVETVMNR